MQSAKNSEAVWLSERARQAWQNRNDTFSFVACLDAVDRDAFLQAYGRLLSERCTAAEQEQLLSSGTIYLTWWREIMAFIPLQCSYVFYRRAYRGETLGATATPAVLALRYRFVYLDTYSATPMPMATTPMATTFWRACMSWLCVRVRHVVFSWHAKDGAYLETVSVRAIELASRSNKAANDVLMPARLLIA